MAMARPSPTPMYSKWIEEYEKENPAVHLTYVSNGSGAGIHDVMMGTVDFAGHRRPSEQNADVGFQHASKLRGACTFRRRSEPTFPSITYRESSRRLTSPRRPSRASISEQLRKWNDPEIAKSNPNVSLPANDIVVVHRQDGSGTTYVWTDYLTKVSSDWQAASRFRNFGHMAGWSRRQRQRGRGPGSGAYPQLDRVLRAHVRRP